MDVDTIKSILDRRTSINTKTGCWEYLGLDGSGYGVVSIDHQSYKVHVLSAQIYLHYVPVPGSMICHKPVCKSRNCWNPEHIYIGNAKKNNWDTAAAGKSKGRFSGVTHCINGHEFCPANTRWVVRNSTGALERECKACRIDRQRTKRLKKQRVKLLEMKKIS